MGKITVTFFVLFRYSKARILCEAQVQTNL